MAYTGERKLGKFRLVRRIGVGITGEVFLAEHEGQRERCAVRILPAEASRDPDFPARFEQEAWRIHALDHPGIVRVRHFGHDNGVYYLAMDHVTGPGGPARSLDARLAHAPRRGIGDRKARRLAGQILDALQYAHERGVLHLSLRPSSILLDGMGRARIVDFGLAQMLGEGVVVARALGHGRQGGGRLPSWEDGPASPTEEPGTARSPDPLEPERLPASSPDAVRYLAPEQRHDRPADVRADLYAFGVILYRMLTGVAAERISAEPSPAVRGVSATGIGVANRCKLEFPTERYPSAAAVKADLVATAPARRPGTRRMVLRAIVLAPLLLGLVWLVTRACGPLAEQVAVLEWGTFETIRLPGQVKMRFVGIPAGSFRREADDGASSGTETRHRVTLTRSFYLSETEVTQAQWEAVMKDNPARYRDQPQCPVEQVSWHDAQRFVEALNGLGLGTFRLPTEAEWEYACRAGGEADLPSGADRTWLDAHAWHAGNAGGRTHPVAGKTANAWGLFDMCGNVGEWCQDRYGPYPPGPQVDPKGPLHGEERVVRGGSYFPATGVPRPALRHRCDPGVRIAFIGFRVVREAEE